MKARVPAALFVLFAVTAFAPAPLPRSQRERARLDEIDLTAFQGTWRVVRMEQTKGNGRMDPYGWEITHVRVRDNRWTFIEKGNVDNASYRLAIDGAKKPAALDFFNPPEHANSAGGSMMGIIRRRGDRIDILYMSWPPGSKPRPSSFETPPEGWFLLKLERER